MYGISSATARTLIHEQIAYLPIGQGLVDDANAAMQTIISAQREQASQWSFIRPGEDDADIGLVYRPKRTKGDHKYFFHFAHDYAKVVKEARQCTRHLTHELLLVDRLYSFLNGKALALAAQFDEDYRELFPDAPLLQKRVLQSIVSPSAYSTTTLRGLWYPNDPQQNGAGEHFDRSLFTFHLGDTGGALCAPLSGRSAESVSISPPPGKLLVFFGVKALCLSGGHLKPLRHASTVEPGQDRQALVHFVHVRTDVPVKNAQETHDSIVSQ